MPIKSLDTELCTGCKVCFDVCPEDVFRFREDERKAYMAYPQDCIACQMCEWFCPVKCITVTLPKARPEVMPY